RSLEKETKQPGVPLAEEALYADIVADDLPRAGKASVKGDYRVEEAIDRQSPGDEVYAEIAGKKQVRLTSLNGNTGGDSPSVQIPGAVVDIMLRHDTAVSHGLCITFKRYDPVHQHQRLIRKPDAGREAVCLGKRLTEHPCYRTPCELETEIPVKYALPDRCRCWFQFRPYGWFCRDILAESLLERKLQGHCLSHCIRYTFGEPEVGFMGLEFCLLCRGKLPEQRLSLGLAERFSNRPARV